MLNGKYHLLPLASLLVKLLTNNGIFFPKQASALTAHFSHFDNHPLFGSSEKRVDVFFLNRRPTWIQVPFSSVFLGWLTRQLKTVGMDPASRYQVVSVGHTQPKHGALARPPFPVTIKQGLCWFQTWFKNVFYSNHTPPMSIEKQLKTSTFSAVAISRRFFRSSKCFAATVAFTESTSAAATLTLASQTRSF